MSGPIRLQPSRWSCLAASWAIVLDIEVEDIFRTLGHDGSEISFPNEPEPLCRKAFHPVEFLDLALAHGYTISQIERDPWWEMPSGESEIFRHSEGNLAFVYRWMEEFDGVITGQTPDGNWHAVAWDHKRRKILDPSGAERLQDYMDIHTFWAAVPRRVR